MPWAASLNSVKILPLDTIAWNKISTSQAFAKAGSSRVPWVPGSPLLRPVDQAWVIEALSTQFACNAAFGNFLAEGSRATTSCHEGIPAWLRI